MIHGSERESSDSPQQHEPTLRLLGHHESASLLGPAVHVHPQLAAQTDVGCVRKRNEDQYLVATLQRSLRVLDASVGATAPRIDGTAGLLLAVADGVGGVPGGEVASAVAIDTVADCFLSALPWLDQPQPDSEQVAREMRHALEAGQLRLREIAARKGLDGRMGTTLTVAYVTWPRLQILHIGDSRAYLLRNESLTHLTRDQTAAQEMLDAGVLRPQNFERSPLRHMLTSALGGGSLDFQLDVQDLTLTRGDIILLCTDGLYGEVPDDLIQRELALRERAAKYTVERLIQAAKDHGGRDNVTAVMASFL